MKIVDLTHMISSVMPVYPGTEPPVITEATTIEKDGFAEKLISFFSHTGTHIDAPSHMLDGKPSLDQFDSNKFIGRGLVVDVTRIATMIEVGSGIIERSDLEPFTVTIKNSDFVLFRTGWDKKWGCPEYFEGFPFLSADAAKWICSFGLKGVGFDCISADPVDSPDLPNHKILLDKEMVIIENLCNLELLTGGEFIFSCLPLKIKNSDGSPIRAVGIM